MEWVEIGMFMLSGIMTVVIGWAIFVTKMLYEHDKSIALNRQDDKGVKDMVIDLKNSVDAIGKKIDVIERALIKDGIDIPSS